MYLLLHHKQHNDISSRSQAASCSYRNNDVNQPIVVSEQTTRALYQVHRTDHKVEEIQELLNWIGSLLYQYTIILGTRVIQQVVVPKILSPIVLHQCCCGRQTLLHSLSMSLLSFVCSDSRILPFLILLIDVDKLKRARHMVSLIYDSTETQSLTDLFVFVSILCILA